MFGGGEKMKLSIATLAKYPFLEEAAEYVDKFQIRIEELTAKEYEPIVALALKKVEQAIRKFSIPFSTDYEIELLAFPVAIILVAATEDDFIQRRYALAEAKKTYMFLKEEKPEIIFSILKRFWGKNIQREKTFFKIKYDIYLHNAVYLKDEKWKLVNRILSDGFVYVTYDEASRLFSETIREYIETKIHTAKKVKLPKELEKQVNKLKRIATEITPTKKPLPRKISLECFPPCIKSLYKLASAGKHLSHIERFTLTSFLINVGATVDEIVSLFSHMADFDEKKTRYQVEHIAGLIGSKTKYTTPNCKTLKFYGLCPKEDRLCQKIKNPLSYYRIKTSRSASTNQKR
ncbi:MAG TPA: hypothetical protein ENG66_00635 [Thermococcus sp.]|nr:hypothetical protein [Thermococcus sp.]